MTAPNSERICSEREPETITTDLGSPTRAALIELLWKHHPPLHLSWVATCALADRILAITDVDGLTRARDDYKRERDDWQRLHGQAAETRDRAIERLGVATRELDDARMTLAEWRHDYGPLVAEHRAIDDIGGIPEPRDSATIALGLHDGDRGGTP